MNHSQFSSGIPENLQDPIEMNIFVACHVACSQHLESMRYAGVDEHVDEDTRVKEFAPEDH